MTSQTPTDAAESTQTPQRQPRLGEQVLYSIPSGPMAGQIRLAVVTGVGVRGEVDLTLFLRPHLDYGPKATPEVVMAIADAPYSSADNVLPGTWTWMINVTDAGPVPDGPSAIDGLRDASESLRRAVNGLVAGGAVGGSLVVTNASSEANLDQLVCKRDSEWITQIVRAFGSHPSLLDPVPDTPEAMARALRKLIAIQPMAIQWVRFNIDCGVIKSGEELAFTAVSAQALVNIGVAVSIPKPTKTPDPMWEPLLITLLAEPVVLTREQAEERAEAARAMIPGAVGSVSPALEAVAIGDSV